MKIPILKSNVPKLGHRLRSMNDVTQPYYRTPEHQRWAKDVVQRAGHRCQRCGREHVRLFADHVVEVRDGGRWTMSNGQALCGSCHTIKSMIEKAKRWRTDGVR